MAGGAAQCCKCSSHRRTFQVAQKVDRRIDVLVGQMTLLAGSARPEAESTVDMNPGACRPRLGDDRRERVELAGIHLAGLQAEDRACVERGESLGIDAAMDIDRRPDDVLQAKNPSFAAPG